MQNDPNKRTQIGQTGFPVQSGQTGLSGQSGSGFTGQSGSGFSGQSGQTGFSGQSGQTGFSGQSGSGFTGQSGSGFTGQSGYTGVGSQSSMQSGQTDVHHGTGIGASLHSGIQQVKAGLTGHRGQRVGQGNLGDFSQGVLRIVAHKARSLTLDERPDKIDPYVRVTCGDVVHKSKAIENGGLNPTWNQDNIFEYVLEGKENSICIEVLDNNLLKDTLIGRCEMILSEVIGIAKGDAQWFRLNRGARGDLTAGEVLLSFQFIPPLQITIEEGRSFMEKDSKPFIELVLGNFRTTTAMLDPVSTKWSVGNTLRLNLKGVDVQNDELLVVMKSKGVLHDSIIGRVAIPLRELLRPETRQWYVLTNDKNMRVGELSILSCYKELSF